MANIYVYQSGVSVNANALYTPIFGAGNVNVTTGGPLNDYSAYNIVIFNAWGASFSPANVSALVTFIQGGGHVCLSTEGAPVSGGGRFMSSVWNALTGQSITETGAGASGTANPPRFHNSLGPWHLSPDPTLAGSTTSYASFANLPALCVTHQRNLSPPTCGNIQALCAVFPSRPNLGDGTLYIQGEIQFPYSNFMGAQEVRNHATALARMHYALIANDQTLLDQLNTWTANLVVDEGFIGNDTIICADDFIPFDKTCPTYASYSWEDFNGNVLSTAQTFTIPDSGSYIIKTTGTFPQCDGLDTLHVFFNPSPKADFSATTVCQGTATVFTNNSTISAPGTATYSWDFGDGNVSSSSAPIHAYASDGDFDVVLAATSDQGCIDDTTITVTVYAEPTADFSFTDDCLYNDPVFTDNSTVNSGFIESWAWNFGDVLPVTSVQSVEQSPAHVYASDGTYDVTLIVLTNHGCDDTIVKTTTRYPVPNVSFTSVPACKGDDVVFTNTSTINAPDNITSWVWNYGDGAPLASVLEESHGYTVSGFYNVTLIASSNNGCVSDATTFVQVYPLPTAEFTATTTCENGNPTSFFNVSSVSQGSIASYNWAFDDNGATSTQQFASYDYSSAGTYNVELSVITDNGCKDTVWHDVEVNPKPTADFISDVTEGCFPLCVNFQENSQSNASSITDYFWFFGNGIVETTDSIQVCFDNISHTLDALYDASLIVTNDLGCKDTLVQNDFITVFPKPLADFEVNPEETNMYRSTIEFTNLSEGGDAYYWDYNDSTSSIVFEEEHTYADTGVYEITLIATTNKGCSDTTFKIVKITPVLNVYIPSAFTPDGDGVNDFFFVEGFAIDEDHFLFEIFDRWGQLVYSTNKLVPWDGTYKGAKAPQDTYVYQVRLRGLNSKKEKMYRGHVTLLR